QLEGGQWPNAADPVRRCGVWRRRSLRVSLPARRHLLGNRDDEGRTRNLACKGRRIVLALDASSRCGRVLWRRARRRGATAPQERFGGLARDAEASALTRWRVSC